MRKEELPVVGEQIKPVEKKDLSLRESQILLLIADGKTSKQITAILGLSKRTIDLYRGRLYKKLGVCNKAQLFDSAFEYKAIYNSKEQVVQKFIHFAE